MARLAVSIPAGLPQSAKEVVANADLLGKLAPVTGDFAELED